MVKHFFKYYLPKIFICGIFTIIECIREKISHVRKSENAFFLNLDKRNTITLMVVSLFRVPQTDATVPSVIQSQDSLKLHCVKIGAVH